MEVKLYEKPELKNPVMLAGAPGMGLVAKQTVDYYVNQLRPRLFGEISSPYDHQPKASFDKGLFQPRREEKPYRFYFLRKSKNDLVFFSGDIQPSFPEKQNELAEKVARVAKELQVGRVYTMAALPVKEHVEEPRIYGVATKPELLEFLKEKGVPLLDGEISGFNGVLIEYASKIGIEGICLLSETHMYHIINPLDQIDFKASLALTRKFSEIAEVEIDTSKIEEVAREGDKRFHKFEKEHAKRLQELARTKEAKEDLRYIG